jgi:hypothetical protein
MMTPQHRAGEAPAHPVVTQDRLAHGDQLLADRRVDDQAEPGVVLDPWLCSSLPRLRRVVLLVEDGRAGVGRRAQVQKSGHRRQQP